MCGICGIINNSKIPVQESSVRKMMQIMKHRGPDDEGQFAGDNIALGFVRLSILDLSQAGHQPMHTQNNRYVIVYNGEIFNYIELRDELQTLGHVFNTNTDTEVLLASYIQWGEDCLNKFNGMWAFVIYDRDTKTIFAARDRFGIKPFYYFLNDEFIAFASEIPPLLSLLPGKPTADNQSIFDYLVFNRTDQTENTFFSEIKKLQHGHKINFQTAEFSNFRISKWYDLKEKVKKSVGFKSPDEFHELFSDSIKLRLRSDVPVGVCLSGGLDSSSIVSVLLTAFDKKDLNTFSAVYNKGQYGDETEFIQLYETKLANMFYTTPDAKSLNTDIKSFVQAHAEPIPSTAPYAQFKVMELAKEHVVVTLDGQGADETLAGYHYFFGFFFKDLLRKGKLVRLSYEMLKYVQIHKSVFGLKTFIFFLLPKKFRTTIRINEKGYINPVFINNYKTTNSIAGNLYGSNSLQDALLNHFEYKLEHLLKWEDRNSMWFSIEARVPFLDYRLVEKTMATSSDMIIKKGMTKHLLRESMKGILPEKIRLRRDKMGFGTPQDEWFRTNEWEIIVIQILNSESFKKRNLINSEVALAQFKKHKTGEINISKEIWKWIHLELWFREFID